MLTVRVRLFARARDLAGVDRCELLCAPGVTVGDVRQQLLATYPALASVAPQLLAAINSDYATESQHVPPHAEVAFFPPVSGG